MTLAIIQWASAQVTGSPLKKLILITLADRCDMENSIHIDEDQLAAFCEAPVCEVRSAINGLFAHGLINLIDDQAVLQAPPPPETYDAFRREIFAMDNWKCVYCGSSLDLTVDHIMPRSRGGSNGLANLATACRRCNGRKGAKTPTEWICA